MDKNRTEGLAKEAKGSVTEAIGKLTGNEQAEAMGAAKKVEGKAQAALHGAARHRGDDVAGNAAGNR